MNPLKQGLKHVTPVNWRHVFKAFIHESIKTRVETAMIASNWQCNQVAFIHESIKTRVETLTV